LASDPPQGKSIGSDFLKRVLVAPKIFKFFLRKGTLAITLWPFVFIRKADLKEDESIMRHEAIHLKQQLELFVIPFYVLYLLEFLYFLFCSKSIEYAYRSISFEREAYNYDKDPNYLAQRKKFAMWRKS